MYTVLFKSVDRIPNPEGCFYSETRTDYQFKKKEDAWAFFEEALLSRDYEGRDYYGGISWDSGDGFVSCIHWNEGGHNELALCKWENFNKDVELGWQHMGVIYHNINTLQEKCPDFKGATVDDEYPFLRGAKELIAPLYLKAFDKEVLSDYGEEEHNRKKYEEVRHKK